MSRLAAHLDERTQHVGEEPELGHRLRGDLGEARDRGGRKRMRERAARRRVREVVVRDAHDERQLREVGRPELLREPREERAAVDEPVLERAPQEV
jgi:hypothetical protein